MSSTLNWRLTSEGANDWKDLPNPSEMTIEHFDVDADSTGRNTKGLMIRDRVSQKFKVSCVWHGVNATDAATLTTLADNKWLKIRFKNPLTGGNATPTVYCGDRSVKVYKQTPGGLTPAGHSIIYEEISINFIER